MMKILMVRPLEHPVEMDIPDTLEAMYEALECSTIQAVYPWSDHVALVCDEEARLTGRVPNRYLRELGYDVRGNFFLCGLGYENFADLPDELMRKFKKMFWIPEMILTVGERLTVIRLDDGTKPD